MLRLAGLDLHLCDCSLISSKPTNKNHRSQLFQTEQRQYQPTYFCYPLKLSFCLTSLFTWKKTLNLSALCDAVLGAPCISHHQQPLSGDFLWSRRILAESWSCAFYSLWVGYLFICLTLQLWLHHLGVARKPERVSSPSDLCLVLPNSQNLGTWHFFPCGRCLSTLSHPKAHGPRIIQAFFTAICDYYLYLLAKKMYNNAIAEWAVCNRPFVLTSAISYFVKLQTGSFSIASLVHIQILSKPHLSSWPSTIGLE